MKKLSLLFVLASLHLQAFEWKEKELLLDGKTVAVFMADHDTSTEEKHTETYKPYLHVYSPDGSVRLTKGPGSQFPHHRGLFVGFNKISSQGANYDRWHMKGGDQICRKVETDVKDGVATLKAEIDWESTPGKVLLKETRVMTFKKREAPFYLEINLETTLLSPDGETVLDGDPEHAGVQFRPSEKIDSEKTVYLFPGENVDAHKTLDLPWAGEIFTVEGKTHTALFLNHPSNPKGTFFSAYRNYGRFGAFPKGVSKPDAPFSLKYRIVLGEGEVKDLDQLHGEWNAFAEAKEKAASITIKPAEGTKASGKK